MEYWIAYKSGRVVEQVTCEDGETPRWSQDSKRTQKFQVERHGDLIAETFNVETSAWEQSFDYALQMLKDERNRRLAECDYPPLYERPDDQQPVWKAYRQALRDLPLTTDPFNPEWPVKPE
jgi:hypothetical protein